ncbi:MAG: thiopeptide-type bacteriocin biosynthesis protein, partial [Saprospiraceae bacterium]
RHLDPHDLFLTRAIWPFLEHFIWPEAGTRAFFIRYEDEQGLHLRLRLRAKQAHVRDTLAPALEAWLANRATWTEVAYEPETDRYGGPEGLALAEEHFHQSTRVVLTRLHAQESYGDALFDVLRLHTILAYAARMTRAEAAEYFGRLADQWLLVFFQPGEIGWEEQVKAEFEAAAVQQKDEVGEVLQALWSDLEAQKPADMPPEWRRWLRANQSILPQFGDKLEKVLPSLLHLSGNRMGLHNQDEVYLLYLLSKTIG